MLVAPLFALAFIAPLILLYFGFLFWIDRYEKEPMWLMVAAFLYGALFATIAGGLLSAALEGATEFDIMAWAHRKEAAEEIATSVWAPIAEESMKGAGVILLFYFGHLVFQEFDGPLDGIVYGGMIGLGFTTTEDALYLVDELLSRGVAGFVFLAFLRTVLGGLAHALYTSMTGLGWGLAVTTRSRIGKIAFPTLGFAGAIGLHAGHNALPTYLGAAGGLLSILFNWFFFAAWFVVIAILIGREKRVVWAHLHDEIGVLVADRFELLRLSSVFTLGLANVGVLLTRGLRAYARARRRQHLLVELAFLKERLERGLGDKDELEREIAATRAIVAKMPKPARSTY